jgi:hypothetical protein
VATVSSAAASPRGKSSPGAAAGSAPSAARPAQITRHGFAAPTGFAVDQRPSNPEWIAREPLPTLMEPDEVPATPTLRPPAAVPPPPRALPGTPHAPIGLYAKSSIGETESRGSRDTPVPAARSTDMNAHAKVSSAQVVPERTLRGLQRPELVRRPAQPTIPDDDLDEGFFLPGGATGRFEARDAREGDAERAVRSDQISVQTSELPKARAEPSVAAHKVLSEPPPASAPRSEPIPSAAVSADSSATVLRAAVAILALLCAALGVVVVMLLVRSEKKAPVASVSNQQPVDAVLEKPAIGCSLSGAALRLAASVEAAIVPNLAVEASGQHLAIGIAATPTRAAGFTIDPVTLATSQVFDEPGEQPVLGVVPLTAGGKLEFAVDHATKKVRYTRTLDATPRITIGMTSDGLTAWISGKPKLVWPLDANQQITQPRVASIPEVGHAVTFRRGGQDGGIVFGWISPDGSAKTALTPIQTDEPLVGTPALVTRGGITLISFAARANAQAKWGVRLALAAAGQLPQASRPFGGTEITSNAISPTAGGLGDGRWLLQWTEGNSGAYRVRLQTLGPDFKPLGDPVTVSPAGANAGQGTVWTQESSAMSLFLVTSDGRHELWGATLKCR